MWTMNFLMFKLVLEKAEEPEIKLPTSAGSWKKQEFQKNIYFCFIDYAKAFDCVDHNKLWKILKEMGIPDHLICLLINLYAGQEATVRTGHGTTDWFQIGKGVRQVCILSPCLFNLYAEYIMRNVALDEAEAGIKIAGNINMQISILSQICRWHHPYGRKRRRTKEPFDESERAEWKSWLKTQHSKNEDHGSWFHHFMAIDGKQWKQWQTLLSWAPKSLQMVIAAMKLKHTYSLEGKLWPM